MGAVHVPWPVALVRARPAVEDDERAVGVDVHVARAVDAAVVDGAEQEPPVAVGAVDGAGPGVLEVVVVARVAVRAVEEDL